LLSETEPVLPKAPLLTTGLESCGIAAGDTAAVLGELAAGLPLEELSRLIATGALLNKRSRTGRQHVLAAIRRRYLSAPTPLPTARVLAAALRAFRTPIAQSQLLLPYVLSADRTAYEIIVGWIVPRRVPGDRITTTEIVEELERVFARYAKRSWGAGLRLRWAQGVLSVLRDVGAVGRGKHREEFLAYSVRSEAFGFHLRALYDSGLRGAMLVRSPFWRMLLIDENEVRHSVRGVVERRWWRHTIVGGVEELLPASPSIEDWATHDLG
jgi:hypothetical protein